MDVYKTNSTRCLGIDPGIGNCGWSVVARGVSKYRLIASGYIQTFAGAAEGSRLASIYGGVCQILTEHAPGVVCIEAVFFNKNVSSCVSTAGVIAVVELAAAHADLPCVQVKPQTVKAATGLGGKASKAEVTRMVNRLLSADIRNAHEADAAAVAIAGVLHLNAIG